MSNGSVQDIANRLAEECLAVQNETGNQRLFLEVSETIAAVSQTLEEAFLTAVRTRMGEQAGRRLLAQRLAQHRAQND